MKRTKKILSESGIPLLSSRVAAVRLSCTQDYIGKLCREGKLVGIRDKKGWFVEPTSLTLFEKERTAAHSERVKELSETRREESRQFQEENASLPVKLFKALSSTHSKMGALAALAGVLLLGSVAFGQSGLLGGVRQEAALSQIESPFFGTGAPGISFPTISFGLKNLFARWFSPVPVPVADVLVQSYSPATPAPTSAPHTTVPKNIQSTQTIVQNTYPVRERVVERVVSESGVTTSVLNASLEILGNQLRSELYSALNTTSGPPSSGGVVNNIALTQRIDKLSGVALTNASVNGLSGLTDADIPNGITASNYLPLSGGTLTGSLTLSSSLNGPLQANDGVVSATSSVGTLYGGTGLTSYTTGDILYASAANSLSLLSIGSSGRVLKVSGGVPVWGTDNTGGGGSGTFATTSDDLAIYPTDITDVVLIGNSATTTTGNIFEVLGSSLFRGAVTTYNVLTAPYFTATSTSVASTFPYASSTALTVSGTGYFGTASTTNLTVSALTSGRVPYLTTAGAFTDSANLAFDGTTLTANALTLTTDLSVANGGTGASSFSLNTPLVYNGSALVATSSALLIAGTTASSTIQGSTTGTSTLQGFLNIAGTNSTSTFSGSLAAAYLNLTGSSASSTFAGGLVVNGGGLAITTLTSASCDLKADSNGNLYCGTDATSAGGQNPFIFDVNYGTIAAATSSPLWAQNGLFASSTSHFVYASSTALTVSGTGYFGTASTTNLTVNLPSSILSTNSSGAAQLTTVSAPLSFSGSTLSITQSGLATDGYLSSTDYTLFNNKISSSSLSQIFPFTPTTNYGAAANSTSTPLHFTLGLQASSTSHFVYASSTALTVSGTGFFGTASTTSFYAAGLGSCSGSANKVVWNSGSFSCDSDQTGVGSSASDFSFDTNYAVLSAATSSPLWAQSGLFASSTSHFVKADFSEATSTAFFATTASTTNLTVGNNAVVYGNIGVSSTTPWAKLSVSGGNVIQTAVGSTTLATTTTTSSNTYASVASGGYLYVADNANGLKIYEKSNSRQMLLAGTFSGASAVVSLAVAGKYAYLGDTGAGLVIVDVSSAASPVELGRISVGDVYGVALSGKYAYTSNFTAGKVSIIDVSDPSHPLLATSTYIGGNPYGLAVAGKYLYVVDQANGKTFVLDVSNPMVPSIVGSYTGGTNPTGIYVSGNYAYIADAGEGYYALDISNPASPALGGVYNPTGSYYGVVVAGNYAYIADHAGRVKVLDVTNPSQTPLLVGSYTVASGLPLGISISGKYAYVAADSGGLTVVDINGAQFPSANIGSLESNIVNITDALSVGGDISVGGGIRAGLGGILSRGPLSAFVGSTTQSNPVAATFIGGSVGIGSSTPYARLSVHVNNGENVPRLFEIASSTASATTTLFTVLNTGRVGIGTTSPYAKLSVVGHTVAEYFTATSTSIASTFPYASTTALTVSGDFYPDNGTGIWNSSGSVGIGTTSPLSKFTVVDTANGANVWIEGNSNNVGIALNSTQSGGRRFDLNSSGGSSSIPSSFFIQDFVSGVRLVINSSGNVGIGTSTPGAKLNVLSTSEQLRLNYDESNYASFTIDSTGKLTIAPTGNNTTISYASSTAITVSGTGYFGTASTTNLTVNLPSSILSTNSSGAAQLTTVSAPLSFSGSTLSLTQSGLATNGYLSSTDYTLFNNKISSSSLSQIFPFTPTTNYGTAANSTSTPLHFTVGLQASSTSHFVYASSTALTVSGSTWLGTGSGLTLSTSGLISNITTGTVGSTGVLGVSAGVPAYVATSTLYGADGIPNSALDNSTISGIALGSSLAALTATNASLTFSGSYDGSTARTVGLNVANANTWTALQTFGNVSITNATSTSLNVVGQVDFDALTSALVLAGVTGILAEYTGTSCTNEFPRSQSALGVWTCAKVANTDLTNSTISGIALGSNLAALTATDASLTFSDSYTGATARTVALNVANANTWTALQTFGSNASSSRLTVTAKTWLLDTTLVGGMTIPKVNLGKDSYTPELQVSNGAGNSQGIGLIRSTASNFDAPFTMARARGTTDSPGEVGYGDAVAPLGDIVGRFIFAAYNNGSFSHSVADFGAWVDAATSTNVTPGRLVFRTSGVASDSPTERMRIDSAGNVGIGTSSPVSTLSVQGSLCVRDTGSCGTTAGTIYATTAAITDIDLAENYPTTDSTLAAGEIVSLEGVQGPFIKRAVRGETPLGIISTKPGLLLGKEVQDGKPVALSGRVPLFVNNEGGSIHIGDYIMLSTVSGVGARATTSAQTVGVALDVADFTTSSSAIINVFVQPEFTLIDTDKAGIAVVGEIASSSAQSLSATATSFMSGLFSRIAGWLGSAGNGIADLFATTVHAENVVANKVTAQTLCLDDLCITKTQLQELLNGQATASASSAGSSSTSTTTGAEDIEAPVITLNGNNPAAVDVGVSYIDLGASVADNIDQNLGYTVALDDGSSTDLSQLSLDTSVAATHYLVFTAVDQAGNIGTATRTIIVGDGAPEEEPAATSTPPVAEEPATQEPVAEEPIATSTQP